MPTPDEQRARAGALLSKTALTAQVLSIQGQRVRIRCPYCSAVHEHRINTSELGQTEYRAPGCGLNRSGAERLAGYRFTTTKEN
jgi:transposase-like protein